LESTHQEINTHSYTVIKQPPNGPIITLSNHHTSMGRIQGNRIFHDLAKARTYSIYRRILGTKLYQLNPRINAVPIKNP
jgi:hypothetical protein